MKVPTIVLILVIISAAITCIIIMSGCAALQQAINDPNVISGVQGVAGSADPNNPTMTPETITAVGGTVSAIGQATGNALMVAIGAAIALFAPFFKRKEQSKSK